MLPCPTSRLDLPLSPCLQTHLVWPSLLPIPTAFIFIPSPREHLHHGRAQTAIRLLNGCVRERRLLRVARLLMNNESCYGAQRFLVLLI